MRIYHRDFCPQVQSRFLRREVEAFSHVEDRANAWIEASPTKVINVETILLPTDTESSDDGIVRTHEEAMVGRTISHCFQVLRVWYQAADGKA